MTERVALTGAQATMLGTLWSRAADARSRWPILGDTSAIALADRVDHPSRDLDVDPMLVAVTCSRARWLDERARRFLAGHPDATVVQLGCGLDTRQQRLAPGPQVRWFEVDQPDVIELRRRVLQPPVGVELIATDVTDLAWLAALPCDRPTLVVAEGLSMYLDPDRGRALLRQLAHGVTGELIMDMNGRGALLGQHLNRQVRSTGARWTWLINDPRTLQRCGMVLLEQAMIIDLVRRLGRRQLPAATRVALRVARLVPGPRGGMVARYRLPGG